MFFLLSKIFWAFAQPISLAAFLALAAFVAILLRRRSLGATLSLFAFLIVALSCWTTLGALMLKPLEARYSRPDPAPAHVDGIVVLGGGMEGGINVARHGYELNAAGDRFVEAAILSRLYPDAKVLISGGTGTLILDAESDAATAERLLTALGVPRERLLLEDKSRNTFENAEFSKALANPQPGQTWLLVTSAFHMPRSVGLFRKAGFPVVPWPTDYRTRGDERIGLARDNMLDSLGNVSIAVREWIGLAAYRLTGKTDALLP